MVRGSIQGLPLWSSLLQAHRLHAPGWCAARGRVEWAFACILTVSSVADATFTVGSVDSDAHARVSLACGTGVCEKKAKKVDEGWWKSDERKRRAVVWCEYVGVVV